MGLGGLGRGRLSDITWYFQQFGSDFWWSILDILLVAATFYLLLRLIRGTQAIQLLRGAVILILAMVLVGNLPPFRALGWLVERGLPALLVAVPVIFQPELRRALERLGRTGAALTPVARESSTFEVIDDICIACASLSERHHGALIVLESSTRLEEYIEKGVKIDSRVTQELLSSIFFPNTALHDGAVVIRKGRIVAAASVLPLTTEILSDPEMGLRHRAAIGATEETDALAIVVSEETGIISVARYGRMIRRLDGKRLRTFLRASFEPPKPPSLSGMVRNVRDRVSDIFSS